MIIVVEGPDGSGKSHLIQTLRQVLPGRFHVIHRPARPPQTVEQLNRDINFLWSLRNWGNFVIDRHPIISESVYGPLLRGSQLETSIPQLGRWDALIYCRPRFQVICQNVKNSSHELEGVRQRIPDIVAKYDEVMGGLKPIRYDYQQDSVQDVVRKLQEGKWPPAD